MHQEPKAWIYCRIDAPEDVHGMLKVQRKQLMDYAEQMGFQVKGSSTDLAAGNSDILPGWEYFLKTAPLQQVEVLLVHNLSRIHRGYLSGTEDTGTTSKDGDCGLFPAGGETEFRIPAYHRKNGGYIVSEQRETREMQYQLSRKLLDLMLKNGFLEPEEYAKIDTLNRSTFSPELAEVYA